MPTETSSNTSNPIENTSSKPGPTKLACIDIEGSGLRLKADPERARLYPSWDALPHRPGVDHACILEVAVVIVDAETLEEEDRISFLVLPPGVDSAEKFDAWVAVLKEKDDFVYQMHSKKPSEDELSLLEELRIAASGSVNVTSVEEVGERLTSLLLTLTGRNGENPVHPGNSEVMFLGNSIANYDLPMFRHWMPDVVKALNYRTMDVSVLRVFYTNIARVALKPELDAAIKSGGNDRHRALDDCLFCVEALRQLVAFARHADVFKPAPTQGIVLPAASEYLARLDHLEMLVRYGSKQAIAQERLALEARDGPPLGSALSAIMGPYHKEDGVEEAGEGIFRTQGGILRAKPSDLADVNGNGQ